jgi:hypothetical protein
MVSLVKSVTFNCADPMRVAVSWAAAFGSNVDEDSTVERVWVEPAGRGGPNLWFQKVPEAKTAKNRQHFDLRAVGELDVEVRRLVDLGSVERRRQGDLVVMEDSEEYGSIGTTQIRDPSGAGRCGEKGWAATVMGPG